MGSGACHRLFFLADAYRPRNQPASCDFPVGDNDRVDAGPMDKRSQNGSGPAADGARRELQIARTKQLTTDWRFCYQTAA